MKMWRKGNPSVLLTGMKTGASTVEGSMEIPQKLKMDLPSDSAILLLGIYLKELKTLTQKNITTSMFIAVLFTIARIWKQPKCGSNTYGTFKQWNSTWPLKKKKGKKILPFATVWMNLREHYAK